MSRLEKLKLWLASERPVTCLKPGQAFWTAPRGRRLRLVRHEKAFSVAQYDDGRPIQIHPEVKASSIGGP